MSKQSSPSPNCFVAVAQKCSVPRLFPFACFRRLVAIGCGVVLLLSGIKLNAAEGNPLETILLWPDNTAAASTNSAEAERDFTDANSDLVAGQRVIRLGNVSAPTIAVYRPPPGKANGTTVLVCPGGGYSILAMDLEGSEVCGWLNSIGVTAVLLKYRVPARSDDRQHILPLQDAQRALGMVRFRATEWHLDPKRIGILGFSAGGHLAAHLSNNFETRRYKFGDAADESSCRPDFTMLIYPAYLADSTSDKKLIAPELKVATNTPPTLLIQSEDDPIGVENSLVYYLDLKEKGVYAGMHIYAQGGHGYGLRPSAQLVSNWPKRAEEWLWALFHETSSP